MKKTNEIAVVNNEIAVVENEKNSTKTNQFLSVIEMKKLFVDCGITPKFTDSTNYVGCGVRSNTFSVNCKKTKYNVYCDDFNFENCKNIEKSLKSTLFIANGNSCDKTRTNLIECKSTIELKKLLSVVLKSNEKIALVK